MRKNNNKLFLDTKFDIIKEDNIAKKDNKIYNNKRKNTLRKQTLPKNFSYTEIKYI